MQIKLELPARMPAADGHWVSPWLPSCSRLLGVAPFEADAFNTQTTQIGAQRKNFEGKKNFYDHDF